MTPDSADFRTQVLLSLQRALWDMVTPSLRGVAVIPAHPLIEARLIYEAVGEEERVIAAEVETYVVADFLPPIDVQFTAVATPPDLPRELMRGEEWVYLRREGDESLDSEDVPSPAKEVRTKESMPLESALDGDLPTSRQAFLAMTDFIWKFAQRAGDDLLTLIGDTDIEADGGPFDPAAWDDWLASVAKIKAGKAPRSD